MPYRKGQWYEDQMTPDSESEISTKHAVRSRHHEQDEVRFIGPAVVARPTASDQKFFGYFFLKK
jgi:hypothetical protein